MSDPTGQGKAPGTPSFSPPEGYASTTLTVQSMGGSPHAISAQQSPYMVKGYGPGTFIPVNEKTGSKAPTRVSAPAKVGPEIKPGISKAQHEAVLDQKNVLEQLVPLAIEYKELSLASEKLRALDLSDAAIAFLESSEDKVSKRIEDLYQHPDEEKFKLFLGELEEFDEAIEKAQKEAVALPPKKTGAEIRSELQQEVLHLSFDVDMVIKEARSLENEIQDGAIRAAFTNATARIEMLFATLKRNPEENTKKEFDKAFAEYTKDLEDIKLVIQKQPRPTPAPTAAPASVAAPSIAPIHPTASWAAYTPTSAPTAAPKPPEPLREYGGWPAGVYFRKQTKGVQGGWFSAKRNDLLQDQEAWGIENEAFKIIFKKYLDFVRGLSSQERRLVKPLIDAKNQLVEAIKDEDITQVEVFREGFEQALEDWKKRWHLVETSFSLERGEFKGWQEIARKILPGEFQADLTQKEAACKTAIEAFKNKALGAVLSETAIAEEIEKIHEAIAVYKKTVQKYQSIVDQQKKTFEAVNGVWGMDKEDKKKLIGVLRPIPTTLNDQNKYQKIRIVGRKDPITLEEYNKERGAKEKTLNNKVLTDDDFDDWPELAKAGYSVQQTVDKKWFDAFQAKTGYERAFARNENSFISLYAVPSLDANTNSVRYAENERLKMHPNRDLIKEVLQSHGIEIVGQTREERLAVDAKKAEEERLKKNANTITYHPNQVRKVSLFGKNDGLVKGYHSDRQMAKQNPETLSGTENRFFALKEKRERYLGNATNNVFEDKEHELVEKLRRATNNRGTDKEKDSFTSLQKALDAYEQELRPIIERQKEEAKLPTDTAEREKRMEALKKIDAIIGTRLGAAEKKVSQKKLWVMLAAAVVTGSMLSHSTMEDATPSAATVQPQEKKDAWRTAAYEFRHQDRYATFSQAFVDDIMKLSDKELMRTHAPKYFGNSNSNNQSSLELALTYRGDQLLEDNTGELFTHLLPEQRNELINIWRELRGASLAASNKPLEAKTFGEAITEVRQKIAQKET